jgi:hypothetical protein
LVIFEGKPVSKIKIEEILIKRARMKELNAILEDDNIVYCYIRKGNYYRPYSAGYTSHKTEAGVYTKQEAVQHAKSVYELSIIPIDIEKHNRMLIDKIADLESRLI